MSDIPHDHERMRLIITAIELKIANQPDPDSLSELSKWIHELNELGDAYCEAGGTMMDLEQRFDAGILVVEKGPL